MESGNLIVPIDDNGVKRPPIEENLVFNETVQTLPNSMILSAS